MAHPAFEQARLISASLATLRDQLAAAAPADRDAIARLIGEAEHYVACAIAAAGLHPSAHGDTELVRPEKKGGARHA